MTEKEIKQIIALVKKEIVPAIGCTEPAAVALCVAKATETLGRQPEHITVTISANVLKNSMGVGVPGTDMVGLPIAVALGALIGKSELGLEVLSNITPHAIEQGKQMIAEHRIEIKLHPTESEKLYIEVECAAAGDTAKAIIAKEHTEFIFVARNDEVLFHSKGDKQVEHEEKLHLTFKKVYDFSLNVPIDQIEFMLNGVRLNKNAYEISKVGAYGHSVAQVIGGQLGTQIFGYTPFSRALAYTTGACDVRMHGVPVAVMSNSGSGNQGITAMMPVISFAEYHNCEQEKLIRALMLSNLTVIYIKQNMSRLSALCGCVVASTGASCAITYLMGGNYEQITFAVKNMVGNITGMLCDGAKPGCALKMSSGISSAMISAVMAMENRKISSLEGIVDEDVDTTIHNLTSIGNLAMIETDKKVMEIMLGKI